MSFTTGFADDPAYAKTEFAFRSLNITIVITVNGKASSMSTRTL